MTLIVHLPDRWRKIANAFPRTDGPVTRRAGDAVRTLTLIALSVLATVSLLTTPCRAQDWQAVIDQSTGHDLGGEDGKQPGRAATASDVKLFAHTDGNIVFVHGAFYPADPGNSPGLTPLVSAPRVVDVNFGPGLPHATVLIAHSSYYGNSGTYVAIFDARHEVLWSDNSPVIRTLPGVYAGVHDFASGLSYPGWVVNRWNPRKHRWAKLTSVGTPF